MNKLQPRGKRTYHPKPEKLLTGLIVALLTPFDNKIALVKYALSKKIKDTR